MRFLHTRFSHDHLCFAARSSCFRDERGGTACGAAWQSLPLHRLSGDRSGCTSATRPSTFYSCAAVSCSRGGTDMTSRIFGAPISRQEDQRFLTGSATYVDDI